LQCGHAIQLLLLFRFDSLDLQQGLQAHDGHRHSTGLIGPTALFSASKYMIQGHGLRLSVRPSGLHKETCTVTRMPDQITKQGDKLERDKAGKIKRQGQEAHLRCLAGAPRSLSATSPPAYLVTSLCKAVLTPVAGLLLLSSLVPDTLSTWPCISVTFTIMVATSVATHSIITRNCASAPNYWRLERKRPEARRVLCAAQSA